MPALRHDRSGTAPSLPMGLEVVYGRRRTSDALAQLLAHRTNAAQNPFMSGGELTRRARREGELDDEQPR